MTVGPRMRLVGCGSEVLRFLKTAVGEGVRGVHESLLELHGTSDSTLSDRDSSRLVIPEVGRGSESSAEFGLPNDTHGVTQS